MNSRDNHFNIEARLDRLERQNRRLKTGMGLGVLLAAVVFGMGAVFDDKAKIPDLIQAREFQVTDEKGNVVGSFGGSNSDDGTISYLRLDGRANKSSVAIFSVDDEGEVGTLNLKDHKNDYRAYHNSHGSSYLDNAGGVKKVP